MSKGNGFKKVGNFVIVFSALTSLYVAIKDNPEIVATIKQLPGVFKK
jgi:hypothetical protein